MGAIAERAALAGHCRSESRLSALFSVCQCKDLSLATKLCTIQACASQNSVPLPNGFSFARVGVEDFLDEHPEEIGAGNNLSDPLGCSRVASRRAGTPLCPVVAKL